MKFLAVAVTLTFALITRAAEPVARPKPLSDEIAALIAAGKPLTPTQSLAAMQTEPGLRVELAAAEPLVGDPVALAWDERGRLFVAENRGYPTGAPDGSPLGMIAMLEDEDGDGVYDRRTEFATGLSFPNGLTCWLGGLIVTCAPDIYFFKDTNGDGRADVKKVLLTGFLTNSTTQIRVAHPILGHDGWVYLTSGLTGGKVASDTYPARAAVEFTKSDSRFRPDTFEFETVPGAAQFGQCFDDFGRRFTVDNRHPLSMVALPPRYLKRNPHLAFSETIVDVAASGELAKVYPLARDQTTAGMIPSLMQTPHAGTYTSACGVCLYGGDALPPEFSGNSFTCEPAQALVQRQVISPDGAMLKSRIGRPGTEVMVTADSWFNPVFAQNAPDGALYIASMYRKFIDHPAYVPEEMRDKLDFNSGRGQGRIYRLVAEGKQITRKPFDLGKVSIGHLVAELANPKVWWRETAFRLLLERGDTASVFPLRRLATSSPSPAARILALRLLNNFGMLQDSQLLRALVASHPGVRENALQMAEPRLAVSLDLAAKTKELADDDNARVRFQAALTLGELADADVIPLLARIAVRDAADKWTRAAALSSVGGRSGEFLDAILSKRSDGDGMNALLADTCRVVGAGQAPETLPRLLARLTSVTTLDPAAQSAAVTGLGEALRARKLSLQKIAEGDVSAREGLGRLLKNAVQLAADRQQSTPARRAAIGLLAFSDFATAGLALQGLINPVEPSEIQMDAVKVLLHLPGPEAAQYLIEAARWKSFTLPMREAILAGLMSQAAGVQALLGAIETGAVAPTGVDPARRAQMLKSRDPAVAAKAEALFKSLEGGDRMKVYEDYKSILSLPPNTASGHAVFTRTCAPCHQINGEGSKVGPDLTGVRNQPAEVLLLHTLVPSYQIVAGFNAYEVETKDERTATGLLAAETPTSVTLRRALGEEETILRANITTMTAGNLSLMPDELEKTMSKQELRDLIGFLKGE